MTEEGDSVAATGSERIAHDDGKRRDCALSVVVTPTGDAIIRLDTHRVWLS